jgi:hypothetical protein
MAGHVNADPAGDAPVLRIADLKRALSDVSFAPLPANTVSRRAALAGLAAVLPFTVMLGVADAGSRKKNKKKRKKDKKPKNNAFGCLNVGQACNGKDDKCCSGICDGKKPKKGKKDTSKCVGHDASICQPGLDICLGVLLLCSNGNGACVTTTGNAPFCAGGTGVCTSCSRDSECVAAGFGIGAACTVCNIECPETGGTFCFSAG